MDAARCQRDRESLLTTPGKCEKRRKQAASGGFLLDTFLWRKTAPAFSAFATSMWFSAQRKVSRPWVREPAFKQPRGSDTLLIPLTLTLAAQVPYLLPYFHLPWRSSHKGRGDEMSISFMVRQAHHERFFHPWSLDSGNPCRNDDIRFFRKRFTCLSTSAGLNITY
ncbi:hypothetical protein MGMO_76c00030 [Methyloglobulus morosus KoM1]|uniref:Uncharacterized protein n=1 Tax=Methyloglobulus morosus KoM1 TaxID=1116472 RepID=V5C5P1_9GAMM|nr:hypothetical protein MGMO_76c00030 [Methyloglobulus morosus KoM1]